MVDAAFIQHFPAELGTKIGVFPFQRNPGDQCNQPQMVEFAAPIFDFLQQMQKIPAFPLADFFAVNPAWNVAETAEKPFVFSFMHKAARYRRERMQPAKADHILQAAVQSQGNMILWRAGINPDHPGWDRIGTGYHDVDVSVTHMFLLSFVSFSKETVRSCG